MGAAFRANDNLILSSDIVRIEYSDLLDGFPAGYNEKTDIYNNQDLSYRISDALKFHAGVEIFLVYKNIPIAIRQGYYRKPSNSLFVTSLAAGSRRMTL